MNPVTFPLALVFHPVEAFRILKEGRDEVSALPAVVMIALAVSARVSFVYLVHFPLAQLDPRDANLWAEVLKIVIPLLTWVTASYGLTSILDGEMLFREVLTASAYCLVPYALLTLPLGLLSHLLSQREALLYGALQAGVYGWVALLLFTSVMTMNDYSARKTTIVCVLSLVGMFLVLALALILYTLTSQFFGFIGSVVAEVRMLLLE
jgi:hypothetical protein